MIHQNQEKTRTKPLYQHLTFLTNKKSKKAIKKRSQSPPFVQSKNYFQVLGRQNKKWMVKMILAIGGGVGNDGGKIYGGVGGGGRGSNGGDDGGGSRFFESNNHCSDSTDVYYQKMIEANPGNPLLLGNYAKFLKKVNRSHNFVIAKAAKALMLHNRNNCGMAILAKTNDGNVLCLYADLIWHNQEDAYRAKTYFDQAVRTALDDYFILASYVNFLGDTGEVELE
ncbi:hypothetical protein DITRI_Ditri02bG0104500 [Diplodiscus trichospermus]